jgi:hypothetical protein
MKVYSDYVGKFKRDRAAVFNFDDAMEVKPVGYRGRRIFPDKADKSNLADAQQDIREYYGLESMGLPVPDCADVTYPDESLGGENQYE